MLATTDIGSLIERRPEHRGGRPVVAGTSVSVPRIVGRNKLGLSPEEIAENFGHLSLAQVHAALAYYHSNREEVEGSLREEEAENDQLSQSSGASNRPGAQQGCGDMDRRRPAARSRPETPGDRP